MYPDPEALSRNAAQRLIEYAARSTAERGAFHLALAGGSTPRGLYQRLASPECARQIDWSRVHVYFGDERCVPPDHPDSNFLMAHQTLLSRVPIPRAQIHAIRADPATLPHDAEAYGRLLSEQLPHSEDDVPQFDLILLGLGHDGHTASLFPGTPILSERTQPAAGVYAPALPPWRVSLTLPVLDHARRLMFLVTGADKAEIVRRVFLEPSAGPPLPVRLIAPRGEVEWHLDAAAAQYLPRETAR
ncbi:MAG: 6-phosphogluconolactonase [Gammaproteobacteria bacterium]|nr:6-phosphogluconolactonase [Gammaproteobacteria bacterium]